ncbi:MAG: hypothetical protein D6731_03185 [Planctomycetota bacterium]|nr:MAG: hypothetical protein D6731_03185 [Planctomycetota bacterium]
MSEPLLCAAFEAARWVAARGARFAVVATSYDTGFEPLDRQVKGKLSQLERAFGPDGWTLWVVDDLPAELGFGDAVRSAAPLDPRLRVVSLPAKPRPGGLKGRGLVYGLAHALRDNALGAVAAVNLNLKVHAAFLGPGLRAVLSSAAAAALGTRHRREGGRAVGRGLLGELKSRAFNALTRALLPPLRGYRDTNAPIKVLSPGAARVVLQGAKIDGVTLDVEWLLLLLRAGVQPLRFPIAWEQRPGSHPPWHLAPACARDLLRLRARFVHRHEEVPCSLA